MKYLSDLLYVDIPTSLFEGEYRTFEVWMDSPNEFGMMYDSEIGTDTLQLSENRQTIYVGRIYGTGKTERIYLNDIISTHVYDNSYIYDHIGKELESNENVYLSKPTGVLFRITVYIVDMFSKSIDVDPYIMNYYRDAKTTKAGNIVDLGEGVADPSGYTEIGKAPIAYNLLNQRTSIYPRVPKLPYISENYWFGSLVASTIGWYDYMNDGVNGAHNIITAVDEGDRLTYANTYTSCWFQTNSAINAFVVKGTKLHNITKQNKNSIVLSTQPSANPESLKYETLYIKLADIDECPAPYYLIWIDRTGAYQSQPFRGKTTLSESISTNYRYDMIDREIPIDKKVTNKWTLNSEWLNYEQYKAYESIFTSKFLYLFNTEYDEGYEVVLDTNEWIEKTKDNRDKLFNLQLELHEARPQNIIY